MTSSHFIPLLFSICLDLPHFVPNVFQLSTCFRNMFIMHIENITCIQFSMCVFLFYCAHAVTCYSLSGIPHTTLYREYHLFMSWYSLVETGGDPFNFQLLVMGREYHFLSWYSQFKLMENL